MKEWWEIFVHFRDIYLDGNFLECEGVIELIKLFADSAEMEAIERAERKEAENIETNTLTVPGVPSAMSSVSRPTSSVSIKSKPGRWVQNNNDSENNLRTYICNK